jgi:hypothetical protein
VQGGSPWSIDTRPEAMTAYHGTVDAHPRYVEAHLGAMESRP